ncbi:MAG: orotidine 5-phosphate decarboxylase [Pseudomonadota bacterium]
MLCVGLDPEPSRFPQGLSGLDRKAATEAFCRGIVEATAPFACAFKPQIAHFAALGAEDVLARLSHWVKATYPRHLWILDAKRGDIGSTAQHYATEAFDRYGADAVTLSPYMGTDSLAPFLQYPDKGVFLLCRTSNPGGDDIQMQTLASGERVFEHIARLAATRWNEGGHMGLVVGATYPAEVKKVRTIAPDLPLLIPGVGAQGGDLQATVAAAATASGGMFINSSRAILYASAADNWQEAAAAEAQKTRLAITEAFSPTRPA